MLVRKTRGRLQTAAQPAGQVGFAQGSFNPSRDSSGYTVSWFLSSPFIIRVPFFLLFGFSKGTLK